MTGRVSGSLLITSVMAFYPDPSLHITARGLTFLIVAGNPVAVAIIMARHPDPFPDSRNPFPHKFPMARNIFGLIPIIVGLWLRRRGWRVVNHRR
jgi:hypothetical protein